MKFPYELSEQRLSLLSNEDKRQYIIEHSEFYSYTEKKKAIKQYQKALLERQGYYINEIEEDEEEGQLNEVEKREMARQLTNYEASVYMDDISSLFECLIGEAFTHDEYILLKRSLLENLQKSNDEVLNEDSIAKGRDLTHWLPDDLKWLGDLSKVLFTGVLGSMVGLLMAGKDKAAIALLERYMNKMVEKVDDGLHKKKTLIGRLFAKLGKRDFTGDQSKTCFRKIQEDGLKKIACDSMVLTKNLGFLPEKWSDAIIDLESNKFNNGGMQVFLNNIGFPISNLSSRRHKD